MAHFGIITPPVSGHLHPFGALGRELVARGHGVTCLHMPDLEDQVRAEGLDFLPIGESNHPKGSLAESLARLSRLDGHAALRFTIRAVARTSEMVLRDAPHAIRGAGIGALLVDQMEPAGGTVAERLGLPFITVCNALPIHRDPAVPPPFTNWRYCGGAWPRLRNRLGYAASGWMLRPLARTVARYREQWELPRMGSAEESFSRLAQIAQVPREFDFPRERSPENFHYVGPLRRPQPGTVPFPWERLDGRPLVYASLGTLQNRREDVFRSIAEACRDLDVQLAMSHGGGLTPEQVKRLPGNAIVVSYAPQLEVLARAQLTITHAGLNTVLDSLSQAVPMVAIPITYEQPAIARRIEWCGAGKIVPLGTLDAGRLRDAARQVLLDPRCRLAALLMAETIRQAGGVRRAADIVEAQLSTTVRSTGFQGSSNVLI